MRWYAAASPTDSSDAKEEPTVRVAPRRTQALIVAALVLVILVLLLLAWRLGLIFGPPETVVAPGATPAASTI